MIFADTIGARTRDAWVATLAGLDACVAPVLSPDEAVADPHLVARGVWTGRDGVRHPAPAPAPLGHPGCARPMIRTTA